MKRKKEQFISIVIVIWFVIILTIIPFVMIFFNLKIHSFILRNYTTEATLKSMVCSVGIEKILKNTTETAYNINSEIGILYQNKMLSRINILNTVERGLNKNIEIESVLITLDNSYFYNEAASVDDGRVYSTVVTRNGDGFIINQNKPFISKDIQYDAVKFNGAFFLNKADPSSKEGKQKLSFIVPVYFKSDLAGWIEVSVSTDKVKNTLNDVGKDFEGVSIIDDAGSKIPFYYDNGNVFANLDAATIDNMKTLLKDDKPFTTEIKDVKKNKVKIVSISPLHNNTSGDQWWLFLSNNKKMSITDKMGVIKFIYFYQIVTVLVFAITCLLLFLLFRKMIRTNRELFTILHKFRRTQKQLVVKERMASLGSLVKGISHELNTPIGVCVTAVSYLKNDISDIESFEYPLEIMEKFRRVDEAVSIINTNLIRSISLINGFKELLHEEEIGEFKVFKVKEFLDSLFIVNYELLKSVKHRIVLQCEYNLSIKSYPEVLMKVITVLLKNSLIHAFTGIVGVIKISARIDEEHGMFYMEYSDNGKGIPAESIPRIFDPFFTTTRSAGCSGLGLTVAHSLVTNIIHGTIECVNQKDNGTKFLIQIPGVEYHFDL